MTEAELRDLAIRSSPVHYGAAASGGLWYPAAHHSLIGERVADVVTKGSGRLLINLPGRHGKSELGSHWVPTWFLDNFPGRDVILASYNDQEARRWGRVVRNEFQNNPFTRRRVSRDSADAARWSFAEGGGGMVSTGMGGSLTGRGGHLIIIDDPIKNDEEANSSRTQEQHREWFKATLYDRLEPGGTLIVIGHRWVPDDLFGYLLNDHADDWEHLSIPMVAELGRPDPMGREAGEALWPERYPAEVAARMKLAMGPYFLSKCQQRPEAMGGATLYSHFSADNVDPDLEVVGGLPIDLSIDFNINPGMHCIVGQHDPVTDELTALHEIHAPAMNLVDAIGEFVAWYKVHGNGARVRVFGDPAGNARQVSDGKSQWVIVRQLVSDAGIDYELRVARKHPGVRDSVLSFNDALRDTSGAPHYRIHPSCKRLRVDFERMRQSKDGSMDKHERDLSHSSDAERYRVHMLRPLRSDGGIFGNAGRFSV